MIQKQDLLVAQTGPVIKKEGKTGWSRLEITENPSCDELAWLVWFDSPSSESVPDGRRLTVGGEVDKS